MQVQKLASRRIAEGLHSSAHEPILPTLCGQGVGGYGLQGNTFVLSFLLHTLGLVLLLTSSAWVVQHREQIRTQLMAAVDISHYLPVSSTESGGGGGGGDRDKLNAPRGALPRASDRQFTPPVVVIRNSNPKLPMEPTVVLPPDIALPHTGPLGDPLANFLGPPSNGPGSGGGIGSGSGGGVGSGRGPGVGPGIGGGYGGGVYRVGGGISAPRVLYAPDPEFSEEARKAKYQGTVVLWMVIGTDGRAKEIRVQRSLGMGLDEKAVTAVKGWRFEPAKKDGIPVAVQVNVEVNFHLY